LKSQQPLSLWQQIKHSPFFIKLLNWEYWPMWITNIPVVLFWLYYALRSRSLFFFSAVNPVIETGGVFGESKINILNRIPSSFIPLTSFIPKDSSFDFVKSKFSEGGFSYPIIAKPNIGERGLMVKKLNNEEGLKAYVEENRVDFILQEFIAFPEEISVMYYRRPDEKRGTVSSICVKEMLKVCGDGKSTVRELIQFNDRAILQLERMSEVSPELLKSIPQAGESLELESIGNHCRGTMFLNGNYHIDDQLIDVFDKIGQQMEGIYYGRFDIKCQSMEEVKKGQGFKILEFNGIASEPAHIYDPSYPLIDKYRDIQKHWRVIYEISKIQRKRGIRSMSWKEAIDSLKAYFSYLKMIKA